MKLNKIQKSVKYYDIIIASFIGALIISNISAVKLIQFGPIITDGGAILFPLTYIFGDILTEVYGYAYARRAVWLGFAIMATASFIFILVGAAPSASEWHNQTAYSAILGFVPRIVLASLIAFLFGQFINAYILAKLKIRTKGNKLWLRLIGSTVVGELIDTTIFALIAFSGILGAWSMFKFILIGWIFKTCIEIIMLPITYRVIALLKQTEHLDKYDNRTDFTPFKVDLKDG
ncbi:MAG: queuosine precursor transporter [Candidatus Saccharibacteria bacterium]